MAELTGEQIKSLSDAIRKAFIYDEFKQFLKTRLGRELEDISLGGSYEQVAFEVVTKAEREGWITDLLHSMAEERHKNLHTFAITTELLAYLEGADTASSPETASTPASGAPRLTGTASNLVRAPRPDTYIITEPIHMEFVRIPAGPFLMGSSRSEDKYAHDNELHQHTVEVEEFYISRYPVTNAQYATFAKVTGHAIPPSGKANHPVDNVSSRDVMVFMEWLSQRTGNVFRLPSEAEWEKAARGTDGRIYPWGDVPGTFKLKLLSKMWVLFLFGRLWGGKHVGTNPVGWLSPDGDSPYGCADMVGTVWEMTSSWYRHYPYVADDGKGVSTVEDFEGWAMRGGWPLFSEDREMNSFARCASRWAAIGQSGGALVGFRVVLSPPS